MGLPEKKPNEGRLIIGIALNKWVMIGDVCVYLEEIRGSKVRLVIQADKDVEVLREDAKIKVKGSQNGQAMPDVQQSKE